MDDVLNLFHPVVAGWFKERLGKPTRIQHLAWKEISIGSHVLATAPTGSGKTLAAFLWSINQLATGSWKTGATRVLYVSPLKALNNDIRRNLTGPLEELRLFFQRSGETLPNINVMTRSGDTPADERRLLYRHPPEILITTPESLNIMLTSKSGRAVFQCLNTVILDEIHALAPTKRGTHLISAVERLVRYSGEFQRIALSASVRPLEIVADFIGGFEPTDGSVGYKKRNVKILHSGEKKRYSISVEFPEEFPDDREDDIWWQALARELKKRINKNRSTLIFTNSRRTAEKVARYLNEGENEIIAYSHHGSIAREIRLEVEERLKKGELRAIVATSSLELGIDIGELDEVILIETPFSISSSLQRIGRAGHGVGRTSAGSLYPVRGMDFLTAAVMARSVEEEAIEPIKPVECPLDILAQVIVSMVCAEDWNIDSLCQFLRSCYPYRHLSATQYHLVLEMLAGRYADSRIKELSPRVSIDKIDNTVTARTGMAYILYTSGGTIPDRGYYDLRVADTRAKIGELDEEFVWERSIGDTFTLGTQIWRIQNITHNDVEVAPLQARTGMVPFWKAEEFDRDFHYSERIMEFLNWADQVLYEPEAFRGLLEQHYSMTRGSAEALVEFLASQKQASSGMLPHRHRILIEHFKEGGGAGVRTHTVLHTFWGGRLNRPFSMALTAAWENKFNTRLDIFVSDANILMILPEEADAQTALRMVSSENLEELLRQRLESTGYFGAKFRINAGRALLLPRASLKKRYPLWLNRLRSKKLLDAISRYPDFPILLETWRECIQDSFDLENLKIVLDDLRSNRTAVIEVRNESPSPFCAGLIWRQTNKYMYEDDTPESRRPSGLGREILNEVLYSSTLRPRIPVRLARELETRLKRTKPGYAPGDPHELLDWLKERLLISLEEWEMFLAACRRDSSSFPAEIPPAVLKKTALVMLKGSSVTHMAALENMPLLQRLFDLKMPEGAESSDHTRGSENDSNGMDRTDFLHQWLSYYGPVKRSWIEETLGMRGELDGIFENLSGENRIVVDLLLEGAETAEVCLSENLERLLRMARKEREPSFKALALDYLPLFLAAYQGLTRPGSTMEDFQKRVEKLFGFAAAAPLWEEEILPARMENYRSAWLDSLLHSSPLMWYGRGKETVSFALDSDIGIFIEPHKKELEDAKLLFPDARGAFALYDIARHSNLSSAQATNALWDLTWKSAVVCDSMEALRKGIVSGYKPSNLVESGRAARPGARRSGMSRWASSRPVQGSWRILDVFAAELDRIDRQELNRERARFLLDRYGVLFRELLVNEPAEMRWKHVFPVLRLMELSGEILSGYFFAGVPGVQFISFEALRFLQNGFDEDAFFWINAKDPASLCGTGLEGLRGSLPRRMATNHLVYCGKRAMLESLRSGRELRIHIPPDDPRLNQSLQFFKTLLSRDFSPLKKIFVEKINGIAASASEYRDAFREFGFKAIYKGLELWREY
jgi:ATP-dependent helicase Lhr and Lhr-like helicase